MGAICPARGAGAGLAVSRCNIDAMQLHLQEISRMVTPGAHAVLLMDRAGWHTSDQLEVPGNISIMFLPPRSPELNPVENIWQFMRSNWLSNRVFRDFDHIIDVICTAWNKLIDRPETITSIGTKAWAKVGQS